MRNQKTSAPPAERESDAEVPLSIAAQRLRKGYFMARDLVLTGELRGRLVRGRWLVSEADVERLEAKLAERTPAEHIAGHR